MGTDSMPIGDTSTPEQKRAELRERIRRVGELYFNRGWSADDIAKSYGYSRVTVHRDIGKYRKVRRRYMDEFGNVFSDIGQWASEVDEQFKEILKRAWDNYNKAGNVREKLASLDRAKEAIKSRFELMQSMGAAPRSKETVMPTTVIYQSNLKEKAEDVAIKKEDPDAA